MSTLPDIEKTPVLLLRFTKAASARLIELVSERLRHGGLVIPPSAVFTNDDATTTVLLTTSQSALEEQAERIHLLKLTRDSKVVEYFTRAHRSKFCDPQAPHRDTHGLFTANEWSLLTHRILDRVTVLEPGETESELSQLLESHGVDCDIHLPDGKVVPDGSFKRRLREHGAHSACLRHVLQTFDLVDVVAPVHLPGLRDEVLHDTWWPWYRLDPPLDAIQQYYGWEIAFYFAWMGFLTKWLVVPGVLGLIVSLSRRYRQDTIDEDEYMPLYGLLIFLWAVLFLRFWDREENRLSYQWGTYSLSAYERRKYFEVRPDFVGFLRISPVTGQLERFYPAIRRRLKYVCSAIVTSFMLAIAFFVMILSLNLQGYIRPHSNPGRWNDANPHPFHFAMLSTLAEEKQLFDVASQWRCYIPIVLHVFCIFSLNYLYRLIAEKLTDWENHETTENYRNSLVLKRFLFEAFDCYVALFYLAFYERDIERLRLELVAVFQIDTIRRLLLECILPMILKRFSLFSSRRRRHHRDENERIIDEADKDTYEQFDDYMEIVIQLGYVSLFASAYPLASLISIVANWVEIRADCFKLAKLCQRPITHRASGLGMWKTLMACVVWSSALTNCLLFGFTSDQMMQYVPHFYIQDERGYTLLAQEKGRIVIFVIFGLERLLILAGLLIYAIVPPVPETVQDELERRQYLRMKELDKDQFLAGSKKTD